MSSLYECRDCGERLDKCYCSNKTATTEQRARHFKETGTMRADKDILSDLKEIMKKDIGSVSTLDTRQVGGSHYQLPIQPIEYIVKNDIPYREGNIIKYVTRYKNKNGKEDLLKAKHYLEMLIEEYED